MTIKTKQKSATVITVLALSLLCANGLAAAKPAAKAVPPRIDPKAVEAGERMGAYLRTLDSFEVTASDRLEEALDSGKKATTSMLATYKVRRPDGFVIDVASVKKERRFVYDGHAFTVSAPRAGYFATVSAPPTIDAVIEDIYDEYGIVLPLADLFYWGTDAVPKENLKSARLVGHEKIAGLDADHYSYGGSDFAWDVWIERGDTPLPLRMVITTLDAPSKPTFTANLTWKTQVAFNADTFTFKPASDAKPIVMARVDQ